MTTDSPEIVVRVAPTVVVKSGDRISLHVKNDSMLLFDAESGVTCLTPPLDERRLSMARAYFSTKSASSNAGRRSMTVVDAHQHFWDPARVSYPWLAAAYPELDRNFGFEDLVPHLRASGVEATVLVQSEDDQDDNELMMDIASRHSEIAGHRGLGAVGRLRPCWTSRLPVYVESSKFVGVRVLIQNGRIPTGYFGATWARASSVLEQHGLTFDVVAGPDRPLEHIPVIVEQHPTLRVVIDHLGKPPIGRDLTAWSERLARAAASSNVFAKVSGLYPARGDRHPWTVDDLRPAFSVALEAFGAHRLMFGSDWPICEVAGGYQRIVRSLHALSEELSGDEQSALQGDTAIRCYGLSLG